MIVIRILFNAVIMAAEIAAVAGVAWLGYEYPYHFSALTAALSFTMGTRLELARLRNELSFYFGRPMGGRNPLVWLVAAAESIVKGLLAGLVALLTFAGTNTGRLFWSAVVFGVCLYAGANILRRLTISFAAIPSRWGFFRLAPPLGLLFSFGLTALTAGQVLTAPALSDIARQLFLTMPQKPGIEQVSELMYLVKHYFDNFIVSAISPFLGETYAHALGAVFSVNTLTGFIIALYAVVIAEAVVWLEERLL